MKSLFIQTRTKLLCQYRRLSHGVQTFLIGFSLLMLLLLLTGGLRFKLEVGFDNAAAPVSLIESPTKNTPIKTLHVARTDEKLTDVPVSPDAAHLSNTYNNLAVVFSPDQLSPEQAQACLQNCKAYIERFARVAVEEKNKFGIPASIILAQGLLESNAGQSRLTKKCNNHFGIKCFSKSCKRGHCHNFTDDTHKDFFINYKTSWLSYRDHSLFLQKPRYRSLYKYDPTDYKGWAHGLKACGYATDPRYASKLIAIIEYFKLDRYDRR